MQWKNVCKILLSKLEIILKTTNNSSWRHKVHTQVQLIPALHSPAVPLYHHHSHILFPNSWNKKAQSFCTCPNKTMMEESFMIRGLQAVRLGKYLPQSELIKDAKQQYLFYIARKTTSQKQWYKCHI